MRGGWRISLSQAALLVPSSSAPPRARETGHDHTGHAHVGHDHAGHDHAHHHSHEPPPAAAPLKPRRLPPSLLRMSLAGRLALVALLLALQWAAVVAVLG